MNANELGLRLHREGCNMTVCAIGSRAMRGTPPDAVLALCLVFDGTEWLIYHTKSGVDEPPIFRSPDEALACDFYYSFIMSLRHEHCVGCFKSRELAEAQRARLESLGLAPWIETIPWGGPNDPRHRVMALGKAYFAAKAEFGDLPVRDDGD